MNRFKLPTCLILVALMFTPMASAVAQSSPGAFARIGFGARGVGMGGSLVADVFEQASPFYNPALAPLAGAQAVDAAAGFLSLDRELQHAQFTFRLPPRAGAAIGIIRAGVSGIDGRDASGYHTGELSTDESVVFTAFGLQLSERVSAGFGVRFYRSSLVDGVSPPVTFGMSFGLAARVTDNLAFGLAVDDMLARYSWDVTTATGGGSRTVDRFPVRLRFGGAYRLMDGRALITAETEGQFRRVDVRRAVTRDVGGEPQLSYEDVSMTLSTPILRLGGEFWLADPFALRFGVDRIGVDGFAGATPSAGFAFRHTLGEIGGNVGYTAVLEPYGLGVMHLVSIQLEL